MNNGVVGIWYTVLHPLVTSYITQEYISVQRLLQQQ